MERWLTYFILGALFSLFLPKVPELFYLLSIAMSCIGLLFFYTKKSLTAFLLGFCFILMQASYYFSWDKRNNIAQSQIHLSAQYIQGNILSLVTDQKDTKRFELKVTHLNNKPLPDPITIRLSWQKPTFTFGQGDVIALKVKLKPAHGLANVGAFSFQKWLLSRSVVLSGYVVKDAQNRLVNRNHSYRQTLYKRLQQLELPFKSLILALALGDKSAITPNQWQVLQQTGTAHLMAISGLHLGLIAALGLYLMRGVVALLLGANISYRVSYWLPVLLSLLLAFGYAFLAGFAVPTLRALIMLGVYWFIRSCYGKVTLLRWVLLSLFVIVCVMPWSILQPSLYLSLMAVASILWVIWRLKGQHPNKVLNFFRSLLIIQLALALLLLPISLFLFKQITFLGLFANIVAVPFLSVTAIPLVLLATLLIMPLPQISLWLFTLASFCLELTWQYLTYLQQFDFLVLSASSPLFVFLIFACLCLSLHFFELIRFKRAVLILSVLLVAQYALWSWQKHFEQQHKVWFVTVFDVGHGLAVMIKKNNQAILYDTGATYPSGFSMTEMVVIPYMQSHYLTHFSKVIISHQDNDHSGGLAYLQEHDFGKHYYFNFDTKRPLERHSACMVGNGFVWHGLKFRMLWPEEKRGEENDDSCVIEISDGKHKVLLPGDISALVEHTLIAQKKLRKVNILLAPHHGSKTSSTVSFVQETQPDFVVYSVGFLNRWKMPVGQVTQRFEQLSSKTFNTAVDGMVQFKISQFEIKAQTYRDLHPFWPWLSTN